MTTGNTLTRLVARRDIVGRDWTFYKGQYLGGKRDGPEGTWSVWPRRAPTAFLVCVPDELVRKLKPKAAA